MNEETESKEATKEEPKEEDKELSMVDKANNAADRLEAANKVTSDNIDRMEKIKADDRLGGTSDAGSVPPEKKEESPQDYAKRILAGEANDE